MKKTEAVYENFWSKILLKKSFEEQFIVPVEQPKAVNWFLKFWEDKVLRPDLSQIKIEKPIFLISPPRSGTTMLQDVMCTHQEVCFFSNSMNTFYHAPYAGEWFRRKLNLNVKGERYLQDSVEADGTTAAEPALLWARWMGRGIYDIEWTEKRKKDLSPEIIDEIEKTIKKIIHLNGENKRFFCKYPAFVTEMRTLQDLFPDAKFINIIRDGRMVANSMLKLYRLSKEQIEKINHPTCKELIPYPRVKNLKKYLDQFGVDDIRTTAHVWNDCMDTINSFKPEIKNYYEVRYEDILQNPQRELDKIFEFCELSKVTPQNESFQKMIKGVGTVHHQNQYKDFKVVEEIAGKNLRLYGYI